MAHHPRDLAPRPDAGDLPASSFQPSPERHDGWTAQRQAAFLEALAATHSVSAAARQVGLSRQSAYKLRARLRGQPFDLAWEAAFRTAYDALLEAAMERAINGVEVPHFHEGALVHVSRQFDERLTLALLAMRPASGRAALPSWHPARDYDRDDFPALLARVVTGPAEWSDGEGEGSGDADAQPLLEDPADWRRYRDEA